MIPEPANVDGWLTQEEGRELRRLAEGKHVLEVGSYCGLSTIWLAGSALSVAAVDTFDGRGTPRPRDTLREFQDNLDLHGVGDKVERWVGDSGWGVPRVVARRGRCFDLAFVDGAHDADSVRRDARLCLAALRPGGLLAFHDHDGGAHPGVVEAVAELLAGGAVLLARVGSLAVVQPAPAQPIEEEVST